MTPRALKWFEDEDPRDLRRWAIAAAIVVAVHIAAICRLSLRPPAGRNSATILADFRGLGAERRHRRSAGGCPAPDLQQQPIEPPPPPPSRKPSSRRSRRTEKVEQQPPPTPAWWRAPKAACRVMMASWQSNLIKQLQKFKRYPNDARARGERGHGEIGFHARSQRPCACASNRAKLGPFRARCRGHSDDRARSAAAGHSGQHAGCETRSHRPDRLFVALTYSAPRISTEYSRNNHAYQTMPDFGRREENARRL